MHSENQREQRSHSTNTRYVVLTALAIMLAGAPALQAQDVQLTLTNLTAGMHFTPRLVVAHSDDVDLFDVGEAPTRRLAWLAEAGAIGTGDTSQDETNENFAWYLAQNEAANVNRTFGNPDAMGEGAFVKPGETKVYPAIDTGGFGYLSMLSMLIPTNDAFVGLDSWKIPETPGVYTVTLNAYDAGSEANDEISAVRQDITGLGGYAMPGMAGSNAAFITAITGNESAAQGARLGTGSEGLVVDSANTPFTGADGAEGTVLIHRGVVGDTNPTGGVSDLDARVHRWLNPVARLVITVSESAE